jgi:hypothetical protein
MIEVFWWFISILVFMAFCVGLMVLYRFFIADYYLEAQRKLQVKLNEASAFLKESPETNRKRVGKGIEGLGLTGLLQEAGIPMAGIVAPFLEGFLKNPANIEKVMGIAKRMGFNIEGVTNESQGQIPGQLPGSGFM